MNIAYVIVTDPVDKANSDNFSALAAVQLASIDHLAGYLSSQFNLVWSPPLPATIQGTIDKCGPAFLAMCQVHFNLAEQLLALMLVNGRDPGQYPFYRQIGGAWTPSLPAGWTLAPNADPTQAPIAVYLPAPQGYSITVDQALVNAANNHAVGFTILGGTVGDTASYTISSDGGGTPITGSVLIAAATEDVSGLDVSSLPDGNLTFALALTEANAWGRTGGTVFATTVLQGNTPVIPPVSKSK